MTVDNDGCEWVNVTPGTGSPGLSQTKSREPENGCSSSSSSSIWPSLFSRYLSVRRVVLVTASVYIAVGAIVVDKSWSVCGGWRRWNVLI